MTTYSVSGPDTDRGRFEGDRAALSYALTRAARLDGPEPASYYVRQADGSAVWRVERHEGGRVTVHAPTNFDPNA